MTSPTGGGSEHLARYRALAEFDNLVREAKKAQRALRELREEEAKLNAQSLADDKKITASKADRARAEKQSADSASKAISDLNKAQGTAAKAGESAGTSYHKGVGKGIANESRNGDKTFLIAATSALNKAFSDAGDKSGIGFAASVKKRIARDTDGISRDPSFDRTLKAIQDKFAKSGTDTGNSFVQGFATKLRDLNAMLSVLGFDKLDLDVSTDDAKQSIAGLQIELEKLAHETVSPQVRIDSNRAAAQLRTISKLFKDELGDKATKEAARMHAELEKIDKLPSGKAFKFWTLTALSDMTRVFNEVDRGTSLFGKLRAAASAGGGGGSGNFLKGFVSGFDEFSESSANMLKRLSRVSGELYRMPGIIALIVSSLPALIAGLGALGGGALGLTSALGSMSGVLAAGPGLISAFSAGIFATSSAFGGMADVLKNAREALEQEAIAKEQSRLGTDKALTALQKYNLAMRDLDPATQKVTEAIVAFSTEWAYAQKRVGENFFKEVVNDTDELAKLLPTLERYLGDSATAVGKLTSQGIRMLSSGPWSDDFKIIGKQNADVIENMGEAGLALLNVFRNITVAAGPFTEWLTRGLKEGAEAFADWSAQAREDGTIATFLMETTETARSLWQIIKNLGNVVNSFFQSTVDEGQRYLVTLDEITGRWADVAKAQEQANSPLRRWMEQIRPVLSALGALIGDLARGLGALAADQRNITTMVDLLNALRTKVLPPILDLLQQLNDSGIAVTIANALGEMLEAIATFLDSGAVSGLSTFVNVLAGFATLLFNIASLPGIRQVLGGVAAGLLAIAAVSIVARFTGLFKLWDFFTWMIRNKGNLSGAFSDAARGAARLQTANDNTALPGKVPSTVAYTGIGAEVLNNQARATDNVARASQNAATKTSLFARALQSVRSGAGSARSGAANLVEMIGPGGPLGIALLAATVAIGVLANASAEYNNKIDGLKASLGQLGTEYTKLTESGERFGASTDDALRGIVGSNPDLQRAVINLDAIGISFEQLSRAAAGGQTDMSATLKSIDAELDSLGDKWKDESNFLFTVFSEDAQKTSERMTQLRQLRAAIVKNGEASKLAADANKAMAASTDNAARAEGALANFIGPVSIETRRRLTKEYEDNASKIKALEGYVTTFGNAESTAAEKANALRDVIKSQTGAAESASEQTEDWNRKILDLRDAINVNGKSLSAHTRAGLSNRDALQAAARAARELYLEDIAAGKPMDDVTRKHGERIKALKEEAKRLGLNKEETKKLINTYGDVPKILKTDVQSDKKGFLAVYAELMKLQVMQDALRKGKSPEQAQQDWNNRSGSLYRNYSPTRPGGDGYGVKGYATGGPVWGAGTRTSDSIRAWLSNGEFVQPTDAVEHYGLPVMEALRKRKLDKSVIEEALPENSGGKFASGGAAHSANCESCAAGGHKFATGGTVRVPIVVNASNTKIDKDWVNAGLGSAGGGKGYRWQMAVLRSRFPGLDLISGYRPGSRTLSGNRSYHSMGRAVDVAPRRDVAAFIRNTFGGRTKELITPWNDLNILNGRPHRYTGAVWRQHAFGFGNAHNHWAFKDGGMVDLMKMLNMNNLAPQTQSAPLPTTPRTLSPAASSVVNNENSNSRTFGDVIINNPVPERGGDSIRNALLRTQLLL